MEKCVGVGEITRTARAIPPKKEITHQRLHFGLIVPFSFREAHTGQTDGQTDRRARHVLWPHNNCFSQMRNSQF